MCALNESKNNKLTAFSEFVLLSRDQIKEKTISNTRDKRHNSPTRITIADLRGDRRAVELLYCVFKNIYQQSRRYEGLKYCLRVHTRVRTNPRMSFVYMSVCPYRRVVSLGTEQTNVLFLNTQQGNKNILKAFL